MSRRSRLLRPFAAFLAALAVTLGPVEGLAACPMLAHAAPVAATTPAGSLEHEGHAGHEGHLGHEGHGVGDGPEMTEGATDGSHPSSSHPAPCVDAAHCAAVTVTVPAIELATSLLPSGVVHAPVRDRQLSGTRSVEPPPPKRG